MATYSPKTVALRRAVGRLLLNPELEGKLCTFEQLEGLLNVLGRGSGGDEFKVVNRELLTRAFRQTGGDKEYILPYRQLDTGEGPPEFSGDTGDLNFLLARVAARRGRGKAYEVCRLTKEKGAVDITLDDDIIPRTAGGNGGVDHPLNAFAFRRGISNKVPKKVRDELAAFLQTEKAAQDARDGRKKKDEAAAKAKAEAAEKRRAEAEAEAKAAEEARAKAEEEARARAEEEAKATAETDEAIASVSPLPSPSKPRARKKMRKHSRGVSKEEMELQAKYAVARVELMNDAQRLVQMRRKLVEMKEKRLAAKEREEERRRQEHEKENTANDSTAPSTAQSTAPSATPKRKQKKAGLLRNQTLYYSVNGRVGTVNTGNSPIIFVEDLESSLDDIPEDEDNASAEKLRRKWKYHKEKWGKSWCWVHNRCTMVSTSYLTMLKKAQRVVKNLEDLFGGGKCLLSRQALEILAAHNLHNYGGSDEATEMIIAGAYKALFHDIGFDITSKQLSKGCPSQRTIARAEFYIAGDCLVVKLQELKDDEAKWIGVITDHGHRAGQDHFVVLITWAGRNKARERCLKFFCLSVDKAGHTAEEASEAVKKVIGRFLADAEIEKFFLGGDAGGGGSVQNLQPKLVAKKVMPTDSVWANCSMHGMTKVVENPAKLTMGDQGLGCRTPWQMVYVFVSLVKWLHEQGGISLLDTFWSLVQNEIMNNPDWEMEAVSKLKQACNDFYDKVNEFDLSDGATVDLLNKFMTEFPRDLPEPVWSRWGTVIKVVDVFLDNYMTIYFLAHGVKLHFDSGLYAWKLACTLISLMNERAAPELDSIESIEGYVDSFTSENANSRGVDVSLKPGDSPSFYTMLLFFRGWTDAWYNDHWAFLMRNDPYFGPGSHGQLARFMAERLWVMQSDLDGLKDGKWKDRPEFAKFVKALEGVPVAASNSNAANREFFDNLPDKFFGLVQKNFDEHLKKRWALDTQLYFGLGGEPLVARQIARMLVHHKRKLEEGAHIVDNDSDTENADVSLDGTSPGYPFPPSGEVIVTLGDHHTVTKGPIQLDVGNCMRYLTEGANLDEMLKGRFISRHWDIIEEFAIAEKPVRLFDKKEDGSIDTATWGDGDAYVNYEPLLDAVHREICPQPNQSQKAENLVQAAALVAKTKVGEKRRTARVVAVSSFLRPFNMEAVETLRKRERDPKKRAKIRRATGGARIRLFSEYIDGFLNAFDRARGLISDTEYVRIHNSIADATNKVSTSEQTKLEKAFEQSIREELKHYKAEDPAGYELTATMGGKVLLRILTKTNNLERPIDYEIMARRIPTEDNDFIKKYGEDADLKEVPINDKKSFLKNHEVRRLVAQNPLRSVEEMLKSTNSIKPMCEEMEAILEKQTNILNEMEARKKK